MLNVQCSILEMNNIAIQFDHVGKLYQLGVVGTGTLSHDLNRWWATKILGKEDPYLKIGETNDRSKKGSSDFVWALRDITFDVEQGDVVGIIGKNGAGKSTLLKLLSRITSPSTGVIRARGRIGSLLEVGTGFHPEMTGRENIYMNGSIMGMTRAEITRKLDEIVEFAGVERYLDTPVKRYSSGMTVRLGFAVAAFMEPEILVVDEVLAVGDAEFQKKAIGKMQDVSQGGGRTVLFVSHNMAAVKNLCKKGVVLENGEVSFIGTQNQAIEYYLSSSSNETKTKIVDSISFKKSFIEIHSIKINNTENVESTLVSNAKYLDVEIEGSTSEPFSSDLIVTFKTQSGVPLASLEEGHYKGAIEFINAGSFKISKRIRLPRYLSKGICVLDIVIHHPNVEYYLKCIDCAILHIDGSYDGFGVPLDLTARGFAGLECD
jgi:lipopolysaccharide transport system ATP-binding protein